MSSRDRRSKFKKAIKLNVKCEQRKVKKRKTFSLYQRNKQHDDFKSKVKRKYNSSVHNLESGCHTTSLKSKASSLQIREKSSSESEDEQQDHMNQLRNTFVGTGMTITDIESDNTKPSAEEINASSESRKEISLDKVTADKESVNSDADNENNSEDETKEVHDTEMTQIENENFEDPFIKHLLYDLNDSLLNSMQSSPVVVKTHILNWPQLGKLIFQIPCFEGATLAKKSLAEEHVFVSPATLPIRINARKDSPCDLNIKIKIGNLVSANKCLSECEKGKLLPLTSLQSEIFSIINNYQDFYFPQRTFENADELRFIYCLHAANHVLKTRSKVLHHNARLSKKDDVPEEFRDQGLTRPKVLIIIPFRSTAYRIIQILIDILITEDKGNVINRNRFVDDYTGNELMMPKINQKPEDYEQTFSGNSNDDFKIGITVTKKSLKLYSDFYSSDIILASPLGLRYTIGAEGEAERDYDFLASIELLIFDQTEVFLMQNWDHVLHLLNHVHLQPKDSHGTDFSRVRMWSLNGWSKYYRQTLIISSVMLPEINSIFNKRCLNYAGKVKVVNGIEFGAIRQVFVQLPHIFQKVNANSVEHSIEARFNYFVGKVLPQQRETSMKHTLIYVTSYFDFVHLRNYFKREDISFAQICEYSKMAKVARARDMFFHGDAHFLLYTERYHFFNRIRVKGIRHLIFYQPPTFPHFYYEICNLMQMMNKTIGSLLNMTVTVLYTKYDTQQLGAIIGSERAAKMIQSERNVHMLVTDGDNN